jgi:pentatricopeptide repeat protein
LKNYPKALEYHNRSFAITLQYQDSSAYAAGYNCLAADYMELKNYPKAIESHMKGLALGKKLGDAESIEYAYDGLIKCYTRAGDYKKALEYKTLFHKLRDSLLNSKNFEEMANLKAGYELEQRDRERALIMQTKEIEQKAALDKQKMISLFLLIGGSIVLILAAVAIKGYLNKKKANVIIAAQKHEVEVQKEVIEEKQKEIIDSINYAKRIQSALLAHRDFLNDHIANNFVLFKPKDIVSGDFYWATSHEGSFYLAVCDSTGHGVPGAFMSLLNIGFLSEAINEKNILEPHLVLNYVRERLIKGVSKEGQRDGFDGILLRIDQRTQKMTYAAANNAPIIIRSNDIIELPKDKMPVGKGERTESFQEHTIDVQKGDTLYLYTDGYADQFGGPKGKKFLYKRLNELLKTISPDHIHNHGDKLNSKFEEWKGALEQVDDVCIIGIKL